MGTAQRSDGARVIDDGPAAHGGTSLPQAGQPYDGQRPRSSSEGLANFLGWFSIGLGLAEIAAPEAMSRFVGADPGGRSRATMRALGLREISSGVGILTQKGDQAGWLWSRVAGDAMDLALLGRVMASDDAARGRTAAATAAVLGVAALDVLCAQQLSREPEVAGRTQQQEGIRTRRSITVGRPVDDVYSFWHDFSNLPRFMRHLESVQVLGNGRSHWKAKAPAGQSVEWDAEIVEDRPNELISWRALENADVYNEGTVRFERAPGGRGTEVRVFLRYDPPGGVIASKLAMLFREEPGQQVQDDLRRFKQVMETGEVMVSDATISKGPHPAQPPSFPVDR